MVTFANELITKPTSKSSHDQFVLSLREVLESLQEIQGLLENEDEAEEEEEKKSRWNIAENPSYGIFRGPSGPSLQPGTSTPISAPSTSKATQLRDAYLRSDYERPKRRMIGVPSYIGSLGGSTKRGGGGVGRRTKKQHVLSMPPSTGTQVCL